ncbi:unnamed protein product [Haemonchus placei]|uniref:MOSC domain-containing protein n=1 Tax=Haemonchus placei TaxID=6290 RepID=A0A0N4WP35_HAEPC|nr:unnamed protein product [Haemonchus placei]
MLQLFSFTQFNSGVQLVYVNYVLEIPDNMKDRTIYIGALGASVLAAYRWWKYLRSSEMVPVGIIRELYVYPVKSCKGISVLSFYCDTEGAVSGENRDRQFVVIDGKSGRFYNSSVKPLMVTIECEVHDGVLNVKTSDGSTLRVDIDKVRQEKVIRRATFQSNLLADGLDCGDEAAEFFSKALDEQDARLLMYSPDLYSERICITQEDWWNNNTVPKRKEKSAFENTSPLMITTQGSLDDLNSKLEKKVDTLQFRPVMVIDECPAWDEDKWLDLQIGDVRLQCFRPCFRCLAITVDPETGVKDSNVQPLKKLREFRLAPEGKMRKCFKDSPLFGVNVGVDRPGYVCVGQIVYARYKKSAF